MPTVDKAADAELGADDGLIAKECMRCIESCQRLCSTGKDPFDDANR